MTVTHSVLGCEVISNAYSPLLIAAMDPVSLAGWITAAGLGKIPTTRARRLISLFTRSRVDQILVQWPVEVMARTSALAASISSRSVLGEPFGELRLRPLEAQTRKALADQVAAELM